LILLIVRYEYYLKNATASANKFTPLGEEQRQRQAKF
jgi:hypothetical protein